MASSSTNDVAAEKAPQRLWRQLAEVLLIVLVFFIAAGDRPPNVNETHYIARIKHYWNPEWCKGDLFLESTDTQVVFIWLFGWITRFASLTATAWIGRIVVWTLLAWSWQRLSWRIVPRPFAACLSAGLFIALNYYCQMAGEWVVGGVEAKCFAYAFILLALEQIIERRWGAACFLLGVAMAFHPIVGGWSALICATMWLISGMREESIVRMLPGIIVGGLLAIVGLVPALSLSWHESPNDLAEAYRLYVFDRLPHHLAILTMPSEEVRSRLLVHSGLLLALVGLSRAARRDRASRRVTQFAWGAAFLAGVGLVIEIVLESQPYTAAKLLRYYWFRLTDFAAPMAVALVATQVLSQGIQNRRGWRVPVLCGLLLIPGCYLWKTTATRLGRGNPPADVKVTGYPEWVKACDWIAANTPPDALFLTPRLNCSFKWRTGRPEVVNRKDIPQDARNILIWYQRLKDIYYPTIGTVEQPIDSIGGLGDERVLELAKKYHASYALSDRSQLLKLPVAYKNDEYVVYRFEDRSAGNSR